MNSIQAIMGKDMNLLNGGILILILSFSATVYFAVKNPIDAIFPLLSFIIILTLCMLLFFMKLINVVLGDYEL